MPAHYRQKLGEGEMHRKWERTGIHCAMHQVVHLPPLKDELIAELLTDVLSQRPPDRVVQALFE
jgi:hypothetical protein